MLCECVKRKFDAHAQGDIEKLRNDLRAAQRRVRELESSGVTAGGDGSGGSGEVKMSSLGLMDNEWQEREQNLLRQLEDERFRCSRTPHPLPLSAHCHAPSLPLPLVLQMGRGAAPGGAAHTHRRGGTEGGGTAGALLPPLHSHGVTPTCHMSHITCHMSHSTCNTPLHRRRATAWAR